jgi:hypothetical protein
MRIRTKAKNLQNGDFLVLSEETVKYLHFNFMGNSLERKKVYLKLENNKGKQRYTNFNKETTILVDRQ